MENGLKELQQRLVEMLSSFQKFTQQNGMIFFLVGGSALGAVRHQGFIPWDDDVDIAMMREDFEKGIPDESASMTGWVNLYIHRSRSI